ncbi:MAG: hypothetical protein ACK4UN_05855, partial [Limisphaerales bacterium]
MVMFISSCFYRSPAYGQDKVAWIRSNPRQFVERSNQPFKALPKTKNQRPHWIALVADYRFGDKTD